jgi:DtxR family Mn-dependent transcriptional regulator
MTLNLEDYLLVMWEFRESFTKVSEVDISKRLKISAPTVTEYISKMEQMGLVKRASREVTFTTSGVKFTVPIVRAHRIAEVFAQKILEVPWEEAHKAVMDLEHLFSGSYGDNLFKHLGYPETCPHGNPTAVTTKDNSTNPMLLDEGTYVFGKVVFEDYDMLRKLSSVSILPGTLVKLTKDPECRIESPNGEITLNDRESMMVRLKKQKIKK